MGQVSSKLRRYTGGHAHWCPACKEMHILPDSWKFDGNLERPTYTPSFKHSGKETVVDEKGEWTGEWVRDESGKAKPWCCHYNLENGVLIFHGDCTHGMRDTRIELPDLPDFCCDEGFGK